MIEDLAQVVPIRVHGLDQAHLPGARSVLHVFLAPKGLRFLARHPIKARTFARRGEYRYAYEIREAAERKNCCEP